MPQIETVKDLQATMSTQKRAVEKVIDELDKIRIAHSPILGADGNPLPESMKTLEDQIKLLANKYLVSPSLLEASQLHGLGENSIQGASFSVMVILSLSILNPLAQAYPVLGKVTMLAFVDTLSQISEEGRTLNYLFENLRPKLNIRAKDGATGVDVLNAEEDYNIQAYIKEFLGMMLFMSANSGYLDLPETEDGLVTLTETGSRLVAHMTSVQQWMNDVNEAMVRLKPVESSLML